MENETNDETPIATPKSRRVIDREDLSGSSGRLISDGPMLHSTPEIPEAEEPGQ